MSTSLVFFPCSTVGKRCGSYGKELTFLFSSLASCRDPGELTRSCTLVARSIFCDRVRKKSSMCVVCALEHVDVGKRWDPSIAPSAGEPRHVPSSQPPRIPLAMDPRGSARWTPSTPSSRSSAWVDGFDTQHPPIGEETPPRILVGAWCLDATLSAPIRR